MPTTEQRPASSNSSVEIPAIPPGVRIVTLANGLTVIVKEDHSAPVVSAQAWCRAGSINEGAWLGAGLSHVLEHMLFKGTRNRAGTRIDQEVQEAGGYMNAYTSFDRTVYWINVPNTGWRVAVDILCDIMQHATLPAEELGKELDVIRREMDMGQDDPGRRSSRRLFETAYTRSPYRYTIIGYRDIFDRLQREHILGYYREKYAPNNCFFVVTGDVKTEEVIAEIERGYREGKFQALPPEVLPDEPRQMASREIIEEAAIELGHIHYSWHIPDLRHPDVPVLDVLATLLGSGRSSRLFQEVRERQGLVNSAEAWTYSPGNPGLFGMSAVVNADKFEPARAAMLAEVQRLKEEPVSAAELAKAVKQFTAGTLASHKTMQGQAQDLGGCWMAAGDLNFSARYLNAVHRVTPADLLRVAREYLTVENRTCYALLPAGTTPRAAAMVKESREHPVQKFVLANGLRLLVKEDHRLPFIEFRAVLKGGVLAESPGNNGITGLLARMLHQGTTRRTARELADEIEAVGGSLDTYGGNNSFGVTAEVMREDFATGLALVADVLLNPAFPEDALERERAIQLAGIKARNDQLLQLCGQLMRQGLFGREGYGLDPLGSESSVTALRVSDLQSFHRQLVVPGNCVLAIYGDVQAEAVREAVEKAFTHWEGPGASANVATAATPAGRRTAPQRLLLHRDKKQAVLIAGFPGTDMFSQDKYALELLQEACSDLGSRLFMRIRDELGLAYYVGAQNFVGLLPGYIGFYCGTSPEHAAQVEKELLQQAESLRSKGISAEELKRAKAKIIGQKKIARQDLGGYAMTNALDELCGLGFTNTETEDGLYEAVTLEDVQSVAAKYLKPESVVVSIVQPAAV